MQRWVERSEARWALWTGIVAAVRGAALGHVALHLRGRAAEPRALFWAALIAAALPPAVLAWELLRR